MIEDILNSNNRGLHAIYQALKELDNGKLDRTESTDVFTTEEITNRILDLEEQVETDVAGLAQTNLNLTTLQEQTGTNTTAINALKNRTNTLESDMADLNQTIQEQSVRQSVMVTKQLLYRRIEIVHPTDWTSTEGLAAWVHTRRQHYLLSSASALFSPTDGQLYEIGTACNDLPVGTTDADIHIKMVITGKNNLVRLYVAVEPYNYVQIQTAGTVTYAGSSQAEFDSITPTVPCRSLDIKATNEALTTHSAELTKHLTLLKELRTMITETDKVATLGWNQAQLNEQNLDLYKTNTNEKITSILDDLNTHSADISNLEQRISGVGEAHESEFQDLAQRIQTNAENIEAVGQAVTENYAELDDRLFINETETEQQRADINALQNKIKNNLIKQSTFTTKTLLYRRIDIVHPTDWTSTEGLTAWVHTRRQHYLLSSASALFSPTDGQLYEIGTACNDLPVGTGGDIHIKMVISGKNNLVRLYVAVEPYNYVQIETAGTVTYAGSNQAEFDSITPTVPCRSLDIQQILTDIQTLHQTLTDTTPPLIPAPEEPYSDANQITRTGIYHPTINTPDNTGTPCTLIVHAATYPEADLTITEQTAYTRNPQTGNPDGRIYKRLLTSGCEPTNWIQITA